MVELRKAQMGTPVFREEVMQVRFATLGMLIVDSEVPSLPR